MSRLKPAAIAHKSFVMPVHVFCDTGIYFLSFLIFFEIAGIYGEFSTSTAQIINDANFTIKRRRNGSEPSEGTQN